LGVSTPELGKMKGVETIRREGGGKLIGAIIKKKKPNR